MRINIKEQKRTMKNYDFVLWDWNGTLLDDLEMNISIMKELLEENGIEKVPSKEFYLEHFGFPIVDFYELIGFDFSKVDYLKLADDYVEKYEKKFPETFLFKNAENVLKTLFENGVRQAVISATGHERLVPQVTRFEISKVFDAILGTENDLGKGKTAVAKQWLSESKADPKRVVFVGDTLHDLETANAIGCDCIFIANGHNSKERLLKTGCQVLCDISELSQKVLGC